MELSRQGMRRGEIVRGMRKRFGASLNLATVVNWTENGVSPYGRVHRFECVPTPELAYVLGVKLGDATQSKGTWQHNYMIKLLVTDKEFADEFSRCASLVLGCNPFKVWWYAKRRAWCTTVGSIMLYKFLEGGLSEFKAIAEHSTECAGSFLRGFFDAEGSISERSLTVSNSGRDLLLYVKKLLTMLGISATGPHLDQKKGRTVIIKGKPYHSNKNLYHLYIRASSLLTFQQKVNFSIPRKRDRLSIALPIESALVSGRTLVK